MVLTERMLDEYLQNNRITISETKRKEIISELGSEPDEQYSWTEQDLYEQLRKIFNK